LKAPCKTQKTYDHETKGKKEKKETRKCKRGIEVATWRKPHVQKGAVGAIATLKREG